MLFEEHQFRCVSKNPNEFLNETAFIPLAELIEPNEKKFSAS
jgi:hypothetical protein